MTKKNILELAKKDMQEALNYLYDYGLYNLVNEYDLKERAKEELSDSVPNYNLINHLISGLELESETAFYNYDMSMGTLESITTIETIADLEDLLTDYNLEKEF